MEYLTLQDIPHRYYDPLHSRSMASSHSERPLGNVAAAVSDARSLSASFPSSSPRLLHPPIPRRSLPADFRMEHHERPWTARKSEHWSSAPSLRYIKLPSLATDIQGVLASQQESPASPTYSYPYASYPHMRPASPGVSKTTSGPAISLLQSELNLAAAKAAQVALAATLPQLQQPNELPLRQTSPNNTLTDQQNHHMRSSPPIQPGEQSFPAKLPSFSEVCFSSPTPFPL